MEELLLDALKYVAAALGGMVFMFILDVIATDRQQDALKGEDACNGILTGKDAQNFVAMVEENFKRAEERRERDDQGSIPATKG